MSIYTRTGDKGQTSLANGERVAKNSKLINFVGNLDELNAHIGFCVSCMKNLEKDFSSEITSLEKIQNNLFVIGSLAVFAKLEFKVEEEVKNLENLIDNYESILPKLTNFILPGGHELASRVHLLRTISRKVEILSHNVENVEVQNIAPYLNRLSDYLFVLARFVNFNLGVEEIKWKVN